MNASAVAVRLWVRLCALFRRHAFAANNTSLTSPQLHLLQALFRGDTLKSHRDLEGRKEFRLHPLNDDEAFPVPARTVRALEENRFLLSNQKFPAATLMLTELGHRAAQEVKHAAEAPATTGNLV